MEDENDSPLVNQEYQLKKYPGKGGWTYAEIPEVLQSTNTPFGWVKVKGSIDGVEFSNYRLMPMGNGRLFLPVKSEIRKKIRKEAGDWIWVVLYPDNKPPEIPDDLEVIFRREPGSLEAFRSLKEGQQKKWIDRILQSKNDEMRIKRIAEILKFLKN